MKKIITSLTEMVGNTPLFEPVQFKKKHKIDSRVLIKLEYQNPSGSIKDRAALAMIEAAEREGKIHPGDTLVEETSGNTGIGLAAFAAAKGYKLVIFFENGSSEERKRILEAYGAKVMMFTDLPELKKRLDEGVMDLECILRCVQKYADDKGYFFIKQLKNPNNPEAHFRTTGPEIWEQTDGNVDAFVAMVGTGGTLSGISRYLKSKNKNIHIVGIQPTEESRLGAPTAGLDVIDGVGAFEGVKPESKAFFIQDGIYDECIEVSAKEAFSMAREIVKTDGLFLGTSGAASLVAAYRLSQRPEYKGKVIVTVAPDNGMKYLSTGLYL